MRVRVLTNAAANATTPELIKGEEVDLPDEAALKLVDGGKAEAVTPSDVDKVRQTVEDHHAKARQEFVVSETSKEIAEEVYGKEDADDHPVDPNLQTIGTADKKIAEANAQVAAEEAQKKVDELSDKKASDSSTKGK